MRDPLILRIPRALHCLAPAVTADLVRLGSAFDGGYVLPSWAIARTQHLLSFGINDDWAFEEDFTRANPTARVEAYDHTISAATFAAVAWQKLGLLVSSRPRMRPAMRALRTLIKYLGFFRNRVTHIRKRVVGSTAGAGDASAHDIFSRTGTARLFAKIDIEGSEYEIIPAITEHAGRIEGLIIEFHDTADRRAQFVAAMEALLEHFDVVHLHANNYGWVAADGLPDVLELTFAPRTRVAASARRSTLPLTGLDAPCNPHAHEYRLEFSEGEGTAAARAPTPAGA